MDFQRKIASGEYLDDDSLETMAIEASEAWEEAPTTGQWSTTIDVADLTKLCNEVRDRRNAEKATADSGSPAARTRRSAQ